MNIQCPKNIHAKILSQQGRDAVKILRKAERIGKKISNWTNHRAFNLRCRRCNVTPTSLRLVSNVTGAAAEKTLKKAEMNLLEIRIRHCNFTIKKLKIEEENTLAQLDAKLPRDTRSECENFLSNQKQTTLAQVRDRQKKKFASLLAKKQLTNENKKEKDTELKERWVVNKSSKVLGPDTINLLRRGLNFAIVPKALPTEEIITSTEVACKNLNSKTAASLRSEVARSVKRKRNPTPNIPREEFQALQELKKDTSVMILPADKGRATVILDKSDYFGKVDKILNDKKTYQILKKNPTTTFKNRLINILRNIKKESNISQTLYRQLYPTSDQAPRFYGLP